MASQQWKDQSALEAFPFRPGKVKSSGRGEIIDRDFLDFHAVTAGPVWLRVVEISSIGVAGRFESASGESLRFESEGFDGGDLPLLSSLGGVRGSVTLGGNDLFSKLPVGTHYFPEGLVEVVGSLVSPPPPGVNALSVADTAKVFGVVSLEVGAGMSLGAEEVDGGWNLSLHADGAVEESTCGAGVAIRSINLVEPGDEGGILISESSFEVPGSDAQSRQIFRVHPAANGIKVQLVDQNA